MAKKLEISRSEGASWTAIATVDLFRVDPAETAPLVDPSEADLAVGFSQAVLDNVGNRVRLRIFDPGSSRTDIDAEGILVGYQRFEDNPDSAVMEVKFTGEMSFATAPEKEISVPARHTFCGLEVVVLDNVPEGQILVHRNDAPTFEAGIRRMVESGGAYIIDGLDSAEG